MELMPKAVQSRYPAPVAKSNHKPVQLTAGEAALLLDVQGGRRLVRRGQEIISERKPCTALFIINEGVCIRYRVLRDGQRHILNIVLPGDFAGIPSCFFDSALYSVKTLTDAVVSPVPLHHLVKLFDTNPRLAAKLFWSFACEAAIYAEHVIAVGRRPALERIAHFLLELLTRLQAIGLANERSYHLPITQEILSDALGLSIPYVNRVLRQLRDDGLVNIKDHNIIIHDVDALASLADFERAYLNPLSIADLLSADD
ncbi:MAG TPA: Crp/Fnr family transcriptional regulator [Stellaceae bacterium]|jgi:CRP-like cAMP-binding protein|nr:Crp/Fnr family transcriptional regulator [Stellaceae bacterium]